jgi:hypothetical protein
MSHRDGLYDVRTEFRPYHLASHLNVAPVPTVEETLSPQGEPANNGGADDRSPGPHKPRRGVSSAPPASPRPLFPTDAYIASDLAEGGRLCDHGKGLVVTRIGFMALFFPRWCA